MADIKTLDAGDGRIRVTVGDKGTETTHLVTVDWDHPGTAAGDLVEASFRFLLDREPKEAILSRFDLSVIGRYFPEYRDRIGDYL